MFDVTALGEFLIDFTPHGTTADGVALFEQNPGGAPVNLLATLSRMGKKTAFLGKVGDDLHGHFLHGVLQENGIDGAGLRFTREAHTTLAFVALTREGERVFSFARNPGADTLLCAEELPLKALKETKIFHFGSLSLTDSPAREATLFAARTAKAAGAKISFDPNYRAPLWPSAEAAAEQIRAALPLADFVKISDEEAALATTEHDPEAAAQALLRGGAALVAVTLGERGALVANARGSVTVAGYPCKAVDTTGAGDVFWGAFLARFLELGKSADALSAQELAQLARFGNAAASLCVQKKGAIPAIPAREAVEKRIEER